MTVSGKTACLVLLAATGAGLFIALASSPGIPAPRQAGPEAAATRQVVLVTVEQDKTE